MNSADDYTHDHDPEAIEDEQYLEGLAGQELWTNWDLILFAVACLVSLGCVGLMIWGEC